MTVKELIEKLKEFPDYYPVEIEYKVDGEEQGIQEEFYFNIRKDTANSPRVVLECV